MEEEEGFEPPRGLTRLSVFKTDPFSQTWVFLRFVNGAGKRTWTPNLLITSQLLYQLSYTGIFALSRWLLFYSNLYPAIFQQEIYGNTNIFLVHIFM